MYNRMIDMTSGRSQAIEIAIGEWKLRSWRPGDEAALVKYANNRNISINLRDRFPHPYAMDDAIAWVQSVKDQRPVTNFAIATAIDNDNDDEAIGSIGLTLQEDVHRRSGEIGYWLAEPFWGRGIATRAVQALTEYAFTNFDLVRLYANVFEWNPASGRVLEKAGFTLEGRLRKNITKDGNTIDQFLYALVR